eukprot:TRINITY_DN32013_c0_g1_i1.p1 TRINITY_DN32013_c0_g1~~TRINITY_DN32013_c0_g1_i1.p1  ORF type:complete len:291 (-),score=61.25 TRINITY_DN32013_c0_g1_i1:163-966(-)
MAASNSIALATSSQEDELFAERDISRTIARESISPVQRILSSNVFAALLMASVALCAVGLTADMAFSASSSNHYGLRSTKNEDRNLLGSVGEVKSDDYVKPAEFRYDGPSALGDPATAVLAKSELVFVRWLVSEGQEVNPNDALFLAKVGGQEVQVSGGWPGKIKKLGRFQSGDVIKESTTLVAIGHPPPQPSGMGTIFVIIVFFLGCSTIVVGTWLRSRRPTGSTETYGEVHHEAEGASADEEGGMAKAQLNHPGLPSLSVSAQQM